MSSKLACPNCGRELFVVEAEYPNLEAIEEWWECSNCGQEYVVRYAFDYVMDKGEEVKANSWEDLQKRA